jgi:hypothetical protein
MLLNASGRLLIDLNLLKVNRQLAITLIDDIALVAIVLG